VKRLRFIWIDDQKKKVEVYRRAIEAGVESACASITLIEVKADLLNVLSAWAVEEAPKSPDLIIIDHIYNMALPFGLKGSSVAHLLRSKFPGVPIVCVTSMFDRPDSFDQEDISEYTALFLYQRLENHIEDLYAIAKDFRKLHSMSVPLREHFVACLKAPRRDKEDLLRILPEEFQDQKHTTTQHRAASWIFNVLLRRPGFLYDRTYAASLLGLTTSGFAKVEAQFEGAKYKGVFATHRDPRWWVSALRTVLFDLVDYDAPDLPQLAGRTLPGIKKADYSVCYVSKESFPPPDAVVATDATRDASLRIVRREYSDRYPGDLGVTPGFETRLILKKRKK